jgi:hypothetical protein
MNLPACQSAGIRPFFKRNGTDASLTDNQGGRIVKEILA